MASGSRTDSSSFVSQDSVDSTSEDVMMAIAWFHPHLTRHSADCMLIDNAPEGAYLLRPASDNSYAVSIKLSSSVQHVKVCQTVNGRYKFGNSTFDSVEGFRRHFELEMPVIGGDSGVTVTLKHPYSRFVDEKHMYTDVVHHAVTYMLDSADSGSESEDDILSDSKAYMRDVKFHTIAVASKEGYLTKLGRIRKSWRVRWFVLRNQFLSYYKTKQSQRPIAILDMSLAKSVEYDSTKLKDFAFRIEFPHRTYFIFANCNEDCINWVELLHSKLIEPCLAS